MCVFVELSGVFFVFLCFCFLPWYSESDGSMFILFFVFHTRRLRVRRESNHTSPASLVLAVPGGGPGEGAHVTGASLARCIPGGLR